MKHPENIRSIEDLKKLIGELFKDSDVKVYLFGSRARGDHMPFSDVDLAFLSDEDISGRLTLLREILDESNFPYKVDLVNLKESKELLEVVLREGVRWL